jgi:hypothetical protein
MRTRINRWCTRAAAGAVAVAAIGACSGGSDGLSASGLHDRVRTAGKESTRCPLDYDLAGAASAAHVAGRAEPAGAEVTLPEDADKDGVLRTARATLVECEYRLGSETVTVETIAAEKGEAVNLLAPLIQRDAGISMSQLTTYLRGVQKTSTGTPLVTPSGNVASVRLRGAGGDTAAVVVSCGGDGGTKLTAHQVAAFTGELAGQAAW